MSLPPPVVFPPIMTDEQKAALLISLEGAYLSGASSAAYEGRSITYRSAAELRRMIDEIRGELGLPIFGPAKKRVAKFDKGF